MATITELLATHGIQADLARALDRSSTWVSRRLRGERVWPAPDAVRAARYLSERSGQLVEVEDLLELSELDVAAEAS